MSLREPAQLFNARFAGADALEPVAALEGESAEDGGADADRAHCEVREAEQRGGIADVRKSGLVSGGGDRLENGLEIRRLLIGLLFVAEGGMQVRIDAGHGDAVHIGIDGENLVELVRQKAIAPHAGVDLDMRLGDGAALGGDAVERGGVILAGDGEGRVQIQQLVNFIGIRGGAEHQDLLLFIARLAQGADLADLCDGEARDTGVAADGRHFQKPEAVAVALEHGDDGGAARAFFDVFQIFAHIGALYDIGFHTKDSFPRSP